MTIRACLFARVAIICLVPMTLTSIQITASFPARLFVKTYQQLLF